MSKPETATMNGELALHPQREHGATTLEKETAARKRAEEALRAREEHFRVALEAAEMAAWDYDIRSDRVFWNDRHFRLFGLVPDGQKKTAQDFLSFVHPDDLPMVSERLREAVEETGTYRAEFRIIRADDRAVRWMSGFGQAMEWDEQKASRMTGVMFDTTERKRAEQSLRESRDELERQSRFFHTTLSTITDFAYVFDREGRFVFANKSLLDLWGLTLEEAVGKNFYQLNYEPELAAKLHRQIEHVFETGEVVRDETAYTNPKGTEGFYEYVFSPLRGANGGVQSVVGSTHVITERKKAETALRESEERFRQFAENSTDVFWIIDAKTRRVEYLNPAHEKIWGEACEIIQADSSRSEHLVHPDDRARVRNSLPVLLTGRSQTVEYRIIRPSDGETRWIRDTGFPIPDENGEITRVAGVAQDITTDKERTAALGLTEERFQLLVEEAKEYAMFLLDPSNEITYWSQGAERVFGWSAEEAVGQSGELIFTPEDRATEQEEKEIAIALRDGTAPDKRWHMRKDGSRIWVDGVMRRLDDEKTGALRGFAKIARNATEQRHAEEQLHRAHEELERRVRERTAELRAKNRQLQLEAARRQLLENEILRITESERARIGQDLHDSLCQELTATAFLLKSRAKAIARQSKAAADSLSEAAETVNANAGFARDLARGLHPFELGAAGLPSALRELSSRTTEIVNCRCDCPRSLRLEQNVAMNLYRIAQEAVTNSVKHAKANEIVISLERTAGGLILSVSDDGEGKRRRGRGLGTHIMQYRARAAGGTLAVDSGRGRGTTVTCRVPAKS